MKVKVYFFAACREIAGKSQMELELREGEQISDLLKTLQSDFNELLTMPIMLAVNEEYARPDHTLHDGDVVALIPLVSGG